MKLIYRGVTYDYNPTNGAARHSFQPAHHTSKSTYELIYRGNTYRVDPNAIAKASVQPVTPGSPIFSAVRRKTTQG
jgi:hypothetical protein